MSNLLLVVSCHNTSTPMPPRHNPKNDLHIIHISNCQSRTDLQLHKDIRIIVPCPATQTIIDALRELGHQTFRMGGLLLRYCSSTSRFTTAHFKHCSLRYRFRANL
ncbi:unnamed protein product [Amoebophrya sp. A25]|nr:unnamed protein product [Amoebophrya sp. A25]|eukprot:GSA25T00014413001.1